MSSRNYEFGDEYDPADGEGNDVVATDAAIYGDLREKGGTVVARAIPIGDIWPDVRQPRRAIPPGIRGDWDGNPAEVLKVLASWHAVTEDIAGRGIDLVQMLMAYDGQAIEIEDPVAAEYLELVSLAASIVRDGMLNPITVVKQGDVYVIETGERRWLAHHLLAHFAHQKFQRINAREVDSTNVWKQAAENGARRPLNAIGMARQLALLLMDMYARDAGVKFDAYEAMVYPEECDRKYYAQVKNGKLYPVKRGYMQRVLDVTGLKNKSQVGQYRDLLNLDDAVWLQADLLNWTEFDCRKVLDEIRGTNKAGQRNAPDKVTTGQDGQFDPVRTPHGVLSPENRFDSGAQTPPPSPLPGSGEGEIPGRRYSGESAEIGAQYDGQENVDYGDQPMADHLGLDDWDEVIDESGDDFEVPVVSTDPMVLPYEEVHQMLHALQLVAKKSRRREGEAAVKKLMLLSPEEIRRIVRNGPDGFGRLMDQYEQQVMFLLDLMHNELMGHVERLRHKGESLYQTYGLH